MRKKEKKKQKAENELVEDGDYTTQYAWGRHMNKNSTVIVYLENEESYTLFCLYDIYTYMLSCFSPLVRNVITHSLCVICV